MVTGDGSITARVVSQTNTNVWAKAGVMFRESHQRVRRAHPCVSCSIRCAPARPPSLDVTSGPIVTAPYWVRMVRALPLPITPPMATPGPRWASTPSRWPLRPTSVWPSAAMPTAPWGPDFVFDNVTVVAATTGTRISTDGAHGAGGDEPCGHQPHAELERGHRLRIRAAPASGVTTCIATAAPRR